MPFTHYWILDSTTTDHMTPLPQYFFTYLPCSSNKKISTSNGTLVIVAEQGEIWISPSIILKNVLHIPKRSTNLILYTKTQRISHNAVFHNNSCIFQDKNMERTIGHARECNDLYCMGNQKIPTKSHSLMSEFAMTSKRKAQNFHCGLGYPSFLVMKALFPSLWNTNFVPFSISIKKSLSY